MRLLSYKNLKKFVVNSLCKLSGNHRDLVYNFKKLGAKIRQTAFNTIKIYSQKLLSKLPNREEKYR